MAFLTLDDITGSLSSAYDSVTGSLSSAWDSLINAEADRTAERINSAVDDRINTRTATPVKADDVSRKSQFSKQGAVNWQALGVIVGIVGILLTVYKLAK